MYAKLQNNILQIAPKQVQWEGKTVINPSEDIFQAMCYLPVQFTDPPTVDDGYYAVPRWTQTENAIVQEWDVVKDTRPLTESEILSMLIPQQINTLDVDDNTALRMKGFYPAFESVIGQTVKHGFKFTHGGKLWKTEQAELTIQAHYSPGTGTESLYSEVCETHAGTLDDPIPYSGNMSLTSGLYYMQNWVIYKCTRDTGNPIYHALSELVGLYVEKA